MEKNYKYYYNKANKYKNNNNFNKAKECYIQALQYNKYHIHSLKELAKLCDDTTNYDDAIHYYTQILDIQTITLECRCIILNEIGVCYNKLYKYEESNKYFKQVIKFKNDIPEIYKNIGLNYASLKQYNLSITSLLLSFKLQENDDINKTLGDTYFITKNYDKSIFYYTKIKNMTDIIMYNLSFSYLASKQLQIGLKLYESRLKNNKINSITKLKERVDIPNINYWNGIDNCNSLLVVYEQGIGDNIQYYKYLIQLSKLYPNMKITYFCRNIISHIFKKYDNINITEHILDCMQFDFKIYIMSLPYILNISSFTLNTENYININNDKVNYWKNKLKESNPLNKLNIGFVYNGLLNNFYVEKYIPLVNFNILTDLDINLICLHKLNEIEEDLKNISFNDKLQTFDIDKDKPFEDTIAILQNIDILITTDTYIVHLAGVLNVNTVLLLGYGSDWRWFSNNEKVWYNSVEILRMNENKELKYILPQAKNIISNLIDAKNNNLHN